MLNLKMIIGSTRPGRAADRVIPWITGVATTHGAFDVEILDRLEGALPPAIMRQMAGEGARR